MARLFQTLLALALVLTGAHPRAAVQVLVNESMSPLFGATEEAIYSARFAATTVSSERGTLEASPADEVVEILERYRVPHWDRRLRP